MTVDCPADRSSDAPSYEPSSEPLLLVVDDDRRLRELLIKFLSDQGVRVYGASNVAEARAHLANNIFDLIVLDVMMPGESGIEFTEALRQTSEIPILLLTAKDQLEDRIQGLEIGADDYLTKPFEPRELVARIRAILRRKKRQITLSASSSLISFGVYIYDRDHETLKKGDEDVFLTSTEATLLKILVQAPNQAFSREELAQRIGHRVSERTIDVQMTRLRRKIGDDPRQPRYLQTVRHVGYVYRL